MIPNLDVFVTVLENKFLEGQSQYNNVYWNC